MTNGKDACVSLCSHESTIVRREPPTWADVIYPAILFEECDDCGDILNVTQVEELHRD